MGNVLILKVQPKRVQARTTLYNSKRLDKDDEMELFVDTRIGGIPKHFVGQRPRRFMQVPDTIRKCTAFIRYKDVTGRYFAGTVFFVSFPYENGITSHHVYAVTAKHVIDAIKTRTTDDYVYLRLNFLKHFSDGKKIAEIATHLSQWFFHPSDPSVDVAVSPVWLPDADHLAYPAKAFATEEIIQDLSIGIGDEVFIAGLFHRHTGNTRNVPIIRVGNIAAMPEELINTKFFPSMKAYLVEARSFGGLSGSPVFVHLGLVRLRNDKPERPWLFNDINATHYLLGLVHGHWDMLIPDTDEIEVDKTSGLALNTGIAIVVPAQQILEVLNQPTLITMRHGLEEAARLKDATIMDSSSTD